MQHGLTSIRGKKESALANDINKFEGQVKDLSRRCKKLETQGGFIF